MGKQREKEGAHRTARRQDDPSTHTHTHRQSPYHPLGKELITSHMQI